jgi:hypothetical protein
MPLIVLELPYRHNTRNNNTQCRKDIHTAKMQRGEYKKIFTTSDIGSEGWTSDVLWMIKDFSQSSTKLAAEYQSYWKSSDEERSSTNRNAWKTLDASSASLSQLLHALAAFWSI